jgi:hypothetical protein
LPRPVDARVRRAASAEWVRRRRRLRCSSGGAKSSERSLRVLPRAIAAAFTARMSKAGLAMTRGAVGDMHWAGGNREEGRQERGEGGHTPLEGFPPWRRSAPLCH